MCAHPRRHKDRAKMSRDQRDTIAAAYIVAVCHVPSRPIGRACNLRDIATRYDCGSAAAEQQSSGKTPGNQTGCGKLLPECSGLVDRSSNIDSSIAISIASGYSRSIVQGNRSRSGEQ